MLESFNTHNEMQYQKLSIDEQKSRGILGRLVGVIADFIHPTRNGRKYTEELWNKTFEDPIMKEKLENRCCFGELGHPVDRQETDMEKIAICLAEKPKKGDDGKLYGVFDILDTPNGRILKTMCDYGCKIGVSSRGSGDTEEEYDGTETVIPDTYECECWDAVLLPAVKSARPRYVTESFHGKTLKMALQESLNSSTADDRKIMETTLNELNISLEEEDDNTKTIPEKDENIDTTNEDSSMAADNSGAQIIQELKEAVKRSSDLEAEVKRLQEKLSVCYTKETRYDAALTTAKNNLASVTQANEKLAKQNEVLQTSLRESTKTINSQSATISSQQERIKTLVSAATRNSKTKQQLSESLSGKDKNISLLESRIKMLNEQHKKDCDVLESENMKLNESLQEKDKDIKIIRSQCSAKITKANELTEKYKTIAKTAIDRYIAVRAKNIGVTVAEIKSKLNENYSFNDIDVVCESLQGYKLQANALPFNVGNSQRPVKAKIRESVEVISKHEYEDRDDDIDDTLRNFL